MFSYKKNMTLCLNEMIQGIGGNNLVYRKNGFVNSHKELRNLEF